ncbi:MAG: ribonuclease J [Synergistaceae bacterium]|jgi:ribonuclease J|nr:ribonuclease J [Synergistaceae bacterium]
MSAVRKKRTGSLTPGAKADREGDAGARIRQNAGLRIIPLGGLGEIGKNITAIEYGDDIIVIDCGLKFPEEEMLGIDFVVPDVTYLVENRRRIRGVFLTHGHEDHIGAVPLVIPRLESPIYGTVLTLALVESKMEDARVSYRPDYCPVKAGQVVEAGCFNVGFIRVSHSIPDSLAIYVKTPLGVVLHSGDFKMDLSPVAGSGTDLSALAELGRDGVLLLLSDSTNSEREGFTPSESTVGRTFEEIFRLHKDRRIVIAAFASNLYRAQQVLNTASRFSRRVMLVGRSMLSYVELAQKLGYIDVPEGLLITSSEAETLAPNRTVVLTTGSQGEPFSGLVLMSKGAHRQIKLGGKDLVVISASPIPGNEKLVSNTVNRLFACGCEVIYEKSSAIHVSGHASKEEQKILLSVVKPKYFMPVHGEYRHLVRHGQLAKEMGIPAKNVFVMRNGDTLVVERDGRARPGDKVQSGAILVDGMMLGEFEGSILRERKELSESGLITISVVLDENFRLIAPVQTDSRGCIYGLDRDNMRPDVELSVERAIDAARSGSVDRSALPAEIRRRIREALGRNFRAYPSILPLITVMGDHARTEDRAPSRVAGKRKRGRPAGTKRSSAKSVKPEVPE